MAIFKTKTAKTHRADAVRKISFHAFGRELTINTACRARMRSRTRILSITSILAVVLPILKIGAADISARRVFLA